MAEESRFEDFVGIVNALHREIQRIFSSEAERLGFKGGDVLCLYYLRKRPEGLTCAELARTCDVSRAAMSRTVARLEEAGLAKTDAGSEGSARYRAPVRITEKGMEASEPMAGIIQNVLDATEPIMDDEQRHQLYNELELILQELERFGREDAE